MFSWRNKKNIMWIPPLICSYAVCLGMFTHPLGVIGRLCSVNVAIPGHLYYFSIIRNKLLVPTKK